MSTTREKPRFPDCLRIVVLDDGETYSGAEGCTLQVITDEQAEDIMEGADADDMDGEPVATYNVDVLPDLVDALRLVVERVKLANHLATAGVEVVSPGIGPVLEAAEDAIARACAS